MISHPFQLLPLSECSCKLVDHSFVNDINGLGLDNESLVTCSDLLHRWFGPRALCCRLRNTTGGFWSTMMLVFYCITKPMLYPEHISFLFFFTKTSVGWSVGPSLWSRLKYLNKWIAMKLGTDIHGAQRMSPHDLWSPDLSCSGISKSKNFTHPEHYLNVYYIGGTNGPWTLNKVRISICPILHSL